MRSGFFPVMALLLGQVLSGQGAIAAEPSPGRPGTWAYVLQAEKLAPSASQAAERLAECDRDWIVLDAFFQPPRRWRPAELERIRRGKPGRKILAYLSIGEAERYRPYWKKSWERRRPLFLGPENPQWKGNYQVRYWRPEWQRLILEEVSRIVRTGFDGLFLDKVDAFEDYEFDPAAGDWIPHRRNPHTGRSYRQDMLRWVLRVAQHGRQRRPGLLIVPQNGTQLLADRHFVRSIDAVAVEDLFFAGDTPQEPQHTQNILRHLQPVLRSGKPVLCIEYCQQPQWQAVAIKRARQHGLSLILTSRELDRLGRSFAP